MPAPSKISAAAAGLVSGAVYGLIVFIIIVLLDHFVFRTPSGTRYGLLSMLIGGAVLGVLFGAIIGLATALSGSVPAGVVIGAILLAGVKLIDAGRYQTLALVMGAVYGALLGWAVANGVAKSLTQAR